jgi:hypothetical protein
VKRIQQANPLRKEKLMECSQPGIIRDEELLAYLSGEPVRPVVQQHLAQCLRCSTRLAEYRDLEQSLIQKLYRWDCPPNQILGEFQLGLLGKERAASIQAHLSQCVLCAGEVTALASFLADEHMLVERAAVQASSQNNHGGAKQAVGRLLEDLREQSAEHVRRIIAALVPPQPHLVHQRRVAPSAWPRRYTAEDFSISLQVERSLSHNDTVQVIGFVTRKGAALESLQGVTVVLSSASATYMQAIDELGNFIFPSVRPATYTLELRLDMTTIVVEQLPVDLQE